MEENCGAGVEIWTLIVIAQERCGKGKTAFRTESNVLYIYIRMCLHKATQEPRVMTNLSVC